MSDVSQPAGRVGGRGEVRGHRAVRSPYYYTTWFRERGAGRGVAFSPLGSIAAVTFSHTVKLGAAVAQPEYGGLSWPAFYRIQTSRVVKLFPFLKREPRASFA